MPFKLIGTIIILVLVTVFCGFNLENKCNINLIFHNFENISVFLALMVSFLAGILVTLPFTLFKKKMTKEQILQASEKLIAAKINLPQKQKKQRFGNRKNPASLQKRQKKNQKNLPPAPKKKRFSILK